MTRDGYKKHKRLIEAWSNGARIQVKKPLSEMWIDDPNPSWDENAKYKIKLFKPKRGERILVSNDEYNWGERTYAYKSKDGLYVCILENPENGKWMQKNETYIYTHKWKYAKPVNE